jgi:hypothetical protein
VRKEVLTEELLDLPNLVQRLASDVDRLTVQIGELVSIAQRLDGRVGNLEGWRYEQRFNAMGRVSEIVRRPEPVYMGELDTVLDARDEGRLSADEWKQLLALDFLFKGRFGRSADAPQRFVALEVSIVVDSRDVQRAHDRAAILSRTGHETIAAVGGSRLSEDAATLAERLGVRTLVAAIEH